MRVSQLAAAVLFGFSVVFKVAANRREKFIDGEFNPAEQFAGVVIGGTDTLFFGHAEVIAGDDKLGVAFQTDDGELAQSRVNAFFIST